MAASILFIHKLTKHFGSELPLVSLSLCGISALIINFLVISVSPFLTKTYYYIAGSMIFAAAIGTTFFNSYLLKRKPRLVSEAVVPYMDAEERPEPEHEEYMCISKANDLINNINMNLAAENENPVEIVEDIFDVNYNRNVESAAKSNESDKITEEGEAAVEETVDETFEKQLAACSNMDQLLDLAFAKAEGGHYTEALKTYEAALTRYRDDSYAPFIVIDISNIHKVCGHYDKAIHCLESAFELPAVQADDSIAAQFERSILELKAAQN